MRVGPPSEFHPALRGNLMSSTRIVSLPALILFLIAMPASLAAQDSATGSIRGTVSDSTSSRIALASIAIVNIATGTREVVYEFGELDELALAYAITIHKSQGSEFPAVVIPLAMQH